MLDGKTGAAATVKKAKVIILEDEPSVAQRLEAKLQEMGNVEASVVSDMQSFQKSIEGERYDVASIDWELHNVYKGPEAIQLLDDAQPEAARVVNTKHMVEAEARHYNVDAFLHKQVNLDPFALTIGLASRLGLARQIMKLLLKTFNLDNLPDLSPGRDEIINEEAEDVICNEARVTALRLKVTDQFGENLDMLTELLLVRGWWESFDVKAYTKLSKREKLKQLVECAQIKASELAQILEVEPRLAQTLTPDEVGVGIDSLNLIQREDELLSILAFVLRIADYDPELVPHFWRIRHMYKESLDRPPWDELGLADYLKANGRAGIIESLTWIRSF
jgi:DNA-binding NarL/FixJ family response regulator